MLFAVGGWACSESADRPAATGEPIPVWSPDGGRLAFMFTRGFELGVLGPFPGHIYVIDLAQRTVDQLTVAPLTSSLGPTDWSADGESILFARVVGEATRCLCDRPCDRPRIATHAIHARQLFGNVLALG